MRIIIIIIKVSDQLIVCAKLWPPTSDARVVAGKKSLLVMLLEDLVILAVKIADKQVQDPVSMDRKVPRTYGVEVLHSMLRGIVIILIVLLIIIWNIIFFLLVDP